MNKVYHIKLKKREPFIFYSRNGRLINIIDNKYPKPNVGTSLWNKNNIWTRLDHPDKNIETITIPTWLVRDSEMYDSIFSQTQPFIDHYSDPSYKDYNMFIITKSWKDGYSQLGMCLYNAISSRRDRKVEDYIKRIEKLKAFS